MSKKPWRNRGNNPEKLIPQKYSWKQHKRFNSFDDADKVRNNLKEAGSIAKVKRCGPAGTKFKVVVGTEIKINKKKKGEKNAAE